MCIAWPILFLVMLKITCILDQDDISRPDAASLVYSASNLE